MFLSQVLAADHACREVVRKFLAWLALEQKQTASPKTGAYCKARARLRLRDLQLVHRQVVDAVPDGHEHGTWCGRRVRVFDGSSVSMPDTAPNQARYPQPHRQKPGCGFPVMRIVACFSLASGLILDVAKDALKVSERTLFRQLWHWLEPDDVALTDCGFCSFADFYLLKQRGVDPVMRNHQRRSVGLRLVKTLDKGDRLIEWFKGKVRPQWLSPDEWRALPDTLLVRELTFTFDIRGFRSKTLVVATTLLDPVQFPKQAFADLYRRRWMAELFFRDIKTTMGMDVLRCKTPDMVEKELAMFVIAHNLVRALMLAAAKARNIDPSRLSFKGTVATIRQWAPLMAAAHLAPSRGADMFRALLDAIARDPVPFRPDRTEPRARKRRPKNYQLLTKPRHEFQEIQHRNRYTKP